MSSTTLPNHGGDPNGWQTNALSSGVKHLAFACRTRLVASDAEMHLFVSLAGWLAIIQHRLYGRGCQYLEPGQLSTLALYTECERSVRYPYRLFAYFPSINPFDGNVYFYNDG